MIESYLCCALIVLVNDKIVLVYHMDDGYICSVVEFIILIQCDI